MTSSAGSLMEWWSWDSFGAIILLVLYCYVFASIRRWRERRREAKYRNIDKLVTGMTERHQRGLD
jgi:hypothetical protein